MFAWMTDCVLLVVIGSDERGNKELIALSDGYRESAASWEDTLLDLNQRGLKSPELAVGDGALGFWKALDKVWPDTPSSTVRRLKPLILLTSLLKNVTTLLFLKAA